MPGTVERISITPVKGLALTHPEAVDLGKGGVPGDRAFVLVDAGSEMISATRLGPLVSVRAEHDQVAGRLSLHFADGNVVEGRGELGAPEMIRFFGLRIEARAAAGPFSEAISELVGQPVRLMAMPEKRPGVDRGHIGAATLISRASLARLAEQLGTETVDARRFRMTFELDGLEPHEEDGWVGRVVQVGGATLRVAGHVGRCVLTTRHPETGVVDVPTLKALAAYRGKAHVDSSEPLPFGVHATVEAPGPVRVGDAVEAA